LRIVATKIKISVQSEEIFVFLCQLSSSGIFLLVKVSRTVWCIAKQCSGNDETHKM